LDYKDPFYLQAKFEFSQRCQTRSDSFAESLDTLVKEGQPQSRMYVIAQGEAVREKEINGQVRKRSLVC
jgi:hypothetical protein